MTEVQKSGVSRRTIAKGAAWTVPVVAVAAAAPAASASTATDIGAYSLDGSCGTLGLLGPGFTLTAGPDAAIPAGTVIEITGSGVANIGVFSITGGAATVDVLSATSRTITLTAPLAPGAQLSARTTLSISVLFTLNAAATLPAGYSGTGSKSTGSVSSTAILCSAN